jgi:hypothetical protein
MEAVLGSAKEAAMARRLVGSLSILLFIAITGVTNVDRASARIPDSLRGRRSIGWLSGGVADTPPSSTTPSAPVAGAVTDNFRILGHERLLKDEAHADVAFFDHGGRVGKYAYVGAWSANCSGEGVSIINVTRPDKPTLVAIAGSHRGESHEDVVVRRIGDRDLLFVGVQVCGRKGRSGMEIFDVTDPRHPSHVKFFRTPPFGVHELDVVQRSDGRVLALLAVPFVEFGNVYFGANDGGEFRIVDVTDPRHPVELSSWGVIGDSSLRLPSSTGEVSSSYQGLGTFAASFAHSVRAADGGRTAYVSYWDAGFLKFDISRPRSPTLVGRTVYPVSSDGDAHSLATYDVGGERYLFANSEDEFPTPVATVSTSVTGEQAYNAIEEPWGHTLLLRTGDIAADVFDAGDGCDASDFTGAAGKIALADSVDPFYKGIIEGWGPVPCTIGQQAVLAARAGAAAFVSNLISPDDAYPYFRGDFRRVRRATEGMPIVQISSVDRIAAAIRRSLERGVAVHMTLHSQPADYGYLRVYRESSGGDSDGDGVAEFPEVGHFSRLPYVRGAVHPPPGSWEIHNTEVAGNRAYSSWYSHGIVALDVSDPTRPAQVGQFVPPATKRFGGTFGAPYPLVWGVAIDESTGTIYASDMRSGLWIVKPTGEAVPR